MVLETKNFEQLKGFGPQNKTQMLTKICSVANVETRRTQNGAT